MLKRLAKQRKHYLSLARKSFKNQENIMRKREAGNILQKGFRPKREGIFAVYFKQHAISYISKTQKGCLYGAAKQ